MKIKNLESKIDKYNPSEIEPKWREVWEKSKIYSPDLDKAKKPFYNLMMFPYPSAEGLHVGNMYAFTGADIYGRFKRMSGFDVFEPIGLDGFGIHSENYALKVGRHPKEQARVSEKNFYRQLKATGNAYDWSRTVETYDPDYYKWTQWIFIQLFKKGLAYRKKSPVNFCPSCKTVLADEQVIESKCERCSSVVEKRDLEQWFFKITDYADRLLNGLTQIDWTEKVKIAQRQWIGRSEGALIEFKVQNSKFKIDVFTVFPETIYGVTYMVLAPEHPFVKDITSSLARSHLARLKDYVERSKKKSEQERIVEGKEKSGEFTGFYCVNPVNNQKVPIWVADYVIASYGTGAVMGVPGSDHRDFAFAKKYSLPIIRVIGKIRDDLSEVDSEEKVLEEGILVNSQQFSGMPTPNPAREKIKDFLEEKGFGEKKNQYHLRDWLISRQRYWGAPIPMIYCEKCAHSTSSGQGWQAVAEKDLPVLLPDVKDWRPNTSTSLSVKGPLANHPEFYNVACPNCGGAARRETDVSDTFLDSSWYFLRYLATDRDDIPFPMEKSKIIGNWKLPALSEAEGEIGNSAQRAAWLPVDMYIGGAEHSVLHLLYVRFITMVLKDLGLIEFDEPFPRFYAHGLIISQGAKMSKSRGNVIIPDSYIKKYGADTLRMYLMFLGPFDQGGDFSDSGIEGMNRFLKRVWRLVAEHMQNNTQKDADSVVQRQISGSSARLTHKTIKKVTEDMENLRYNTAIAHIMEYYNQLHSFYTKYKILDTEYCKTLVLLLAPFAPHMTEELWQMIRIKDKGLRINSSFIIHHSSSESIHFQPWPKYDPKLLEEEEVTIVVQVNGKMRDTIKTQNSKLKSQNSPASPSEAGRAKIKNQKDVEQMAEESANVKKYLAGKTVKKIIHVEGKLINFVTE